ncbi:hypothetical protein [Virgibacillus siamensis]|uniref:hypothetical protein n=1 Tax=Virgibacillus siamensis TaxID=480071 RepID=UPI000985B7BA|nr:hypothetical protein [Virgibacillus siamensis]
MFFVENCFYWIGFHLVDYLLNQGYAVTGDDHIDTEGKEHLSMLIGRNENFVHLKEPRNAADYDICFTPKENTLKMYKNSTSTIKLPLLFGEWMPMEADGMYHRGTFIPFDSDRFLQEAVYIGDFLNTIQQCIDATRLPRFLNVNAGQQKSSADIKLEDSVFIRNNRPIMSRLKAVQSHYKRFGEFYQCH